MRGFFSLVQIFFSITPALVYLVGGPPHQDMWDIKEDAPVEIRGEFSPVSTRVPGIRICEEFPEIARIMREQADVARRRRTVVVSHYRLRVFKRNGVIENGVRTHIGCQPPHQRPTGRPHPRNDPHVRRRFIRRKNDLFALMDQRGEGVEKLFLCRILDRH